MSDDMQSTADKTFPARSTFSKLVLIGLVLMVTVQLLTGFALMFHSGAPLLAAHITSGLALLLLVALEWVWLCATRPGRCRLGGFISAGSGLAEWSEAAFLIVITFTAIFGALLAAIMKLGLHLPFGLLLETHRALASIVLILYLAHSVFAMRHGRSRTSHPRQI